MILIIMFLNIITYIYEINNYVVDKNIKNIVVKSSWTTYL